MRLNLKSARLSAGIKQIELADIMKVSKQTINKWEMGRAPVSKKHWGKLAFVLHLTDVELEMVLVETLLGACIDAMDVTPLLNARTSRLYSTELITDAILRFGAMTRDVNNSSAPNPSMSDREKLDYERQIFERDKKIFELEKEVERLKKELFRISSLCGLNITTNEIEVTQ